MEMTFEDAILCLKGIKQYGSDTFTKRSQGDWQNSLDLAIETIRKYQKIKEIIKDDTYYEEYGNNAEKFIVSAISEVENGNDD